jgi:DNA invertase Pin-like site-specific DNA recombinase
MLIGYLNLAATQLAAGMSEPHNRLIGCGVQRLFIDVDLGNGVTPQLDAALAELGEGDTLVSPSVDMLARSITALLEINARLDAKGAALRVLQLAGGMPLDTATAEGRAILGALAVMSALPQPVAASMPAQPREAAWSDTAAQPMSHMLPSRPRGRPATAVTQASEVTRLRSQGLRAVEIAAHLGIGRASVYRILSQAPQPDAPIASHGRSPSTSRVLTYIPL